jgi:hypothetical protein
LIQTKELKTMSAALPSPSSSQSVLQSPVLAIGLMSGTAQDGVDVALIETDGEIIDRFGPTAYRTYSKSERALLRRATRRGSKPGMPPAGRSTRSKRKPLLNWRCAAFAVCRSRFPAPPAHRIRLPAAFWSKCDPCPLTVNPSFLPNQTTRTRVLRRALSK